MLNLETDLLITCNLEAYSYGAKNKVSKCFKKV
jgi:hypothetical protein